MDPTPTPSSGVTPPVSRHPASALPAVGAHGRAPSPPVPAVPASAPLSPNRPRRGGRREPPRHRVARRFLPLLFLLAALALPLPPTAQPPVAAAQSPVGAPSRAPSTPAPAFTPTVTRNEATPNFPDTVTFALDATSDTPIERVELLYAPAGQETLNLVTPAHDPGTEIDVAHDLDLGGGALPPGVDVTYRWRLLDAAGNATETDPQTFLWEDDRFDWQPLAGERVTIYAYAGDDAFNQAVLETAERTLDRLEPIYAARLPAPIRLWVYASLEDFAGALRPNTEPWIGGAAYPALGLIHAVLPVGEAAEIGRVVPHEVSHVLLHEATRNPFNGPPNWLDEGLATRAQEVADPSYPDLVRAAAADGRLESVRALNAQFPYDPEGARLAYAQSLSLVEHILDTHGPDAMARLIAAYRDGVSHDDAVRRALGRSLDQLDAEWRASLDAQDPAPGASTGAPEQSDDSGGLGLPDAALLASGALVMGLVGLLALVAGTLAIRRGRLPPDPLDADEDARADPAGPFGRASQP